MPQKILISIPAKNEASTIDSVIKSTAEAVTQATGDTPDVLVISNGSTDQTAAVAQAAGAKVMEHQTSPGLGYVFGEAVEYALANDYDLMLTIDGDGQFSPDDIEALIKPILANKADFVTGSRFSNGSIVTAIPQAKLIGNKLMSYLISSILQQKFYDVSCGFRVYNREALCHTNVFSRFTYTQEVFLNLGVKKIRITEVPITVKYFAARRSRIAHNLVRYAWQTAKIIFKSVITYTPMRLFGSLAALFFILGAPVVLALAIRYYQTDLITPFKGFAITGLIFLVLSFVSFLAGIGLEILSRIQLTIERNIYYVRRRS